MQALNHYDEHIFNNIDVDVTFLISRFGWFGKDAEEVAKPRLNYLCTGQSVVRCTAISNDLSLLLNI